MSETVDWIGTSFHVCNPSANWKDAGGVYIFCGLNSNQQWFPVYIGQAESLAARLPNHERWQEAAKLGATHVHARVVEQAANRDALEQKLIVAFQPKLNTHYK